MSELQKYSGVEADVWQPLKAFTDARIALGRTGVAIPLKESLNFKMAHAHARDAVYSELNEATLIENLKNFNYLFTHCTARRRTDTNIFNDPITVGN